MISFPRLTEVLPNISLPVIILNISEITVNGINGFSPDSDPRDNSPNAFEFESREDVLKAPNTQPPFRNWEGDGLPAYPMQMKFV
jgi:hypothetical protein